MLCSSLFKCGSYCRPDSSGSDSSTGDIIHTVKTVVRNDLAGHLSDGIAADTLGLVVGADFNIGDNAAGDSNGDFKLTTNTGLVTLAGLLTNDDLQCVDPQGNVIPGLWAAGNCLGERYGNQYATPFAGNSIGMACTHGRVAGKLATGQSVL